MTSRASLLAALVLVATLSACTGSDRSSAGAASAPTTPAGAASLPATPTGNVSPAAPPASRAQVRDVAEALFLTPSKNIGCHLSRDGVRCDIGRRDWTPPPKPADCELDWGFGVYIVPGKPAAFVCTGDSLLGATKDTLPYGHVLRAGAFQCDSEYVALRCSNERTGHGFTLSVQDYTIF
jgi:hypothetical protein